MTAAQKQQIKQMRWDGAGYGKIATVLGISKETIKSFCRRNMIPSDVQDMSVDSIVTKTTTALDGIACKQCGKCLNQQPKLKPRRFCSDKCRLSWWRDHDNQLNKKAVYTFRCAGCGQTFESYGNKARKYCGHTCYIKNRFGGAEHDQRAI